MNNAIYAGFADVDMARKAVGALLDHGATAECISMVYRQRAADAEGDVDDDVDIVEDANKGITTTTSKDAGAGAAIGAGVGAGLGALAALASLTIPGFGLVLGGGALATALMGAAGSAVGGAIAGGVTGYLRDMGVDAEAAQDYENAIESGGAMIGIQHPCGQLDADEIRNTLIKYNATHIRNFEGSIRR